MDPSRLTGKKVVVTSVGMSYTGTLVEINESAVILRAETGFREIPLELITVIEPSGDTAATASSLPPSPLRRIKR